MSPFFVPSRTCPLPSGFGILKLHDHGKNRYLQTPEYRSSFYLSSIKDNFGFSHCYLIQPTSFSYSTLYFCSSTCPGPLTRLIFVVQARYLGITLCHVFIKICTKQSKTTKTIIRECLEGLRDWFFISPKMKTSLRMRFPLGKFPLFFDGYKG